MRLHGLQAEEVAADWCNGRVQVTAGLVNHILGDREKGGKEGGRERGRERKGKNVYEFELRRLAVYSIADYYTETLNRTGSHPSRPLVIEAALAERARGQEQKKRLGSLPTIRE